MPDGYSDPGMDAEAVVEEPSGRHASAETAGTSGTAGTAGTGETAEAADTAETTEAADTAETAEAADTAETAEAADTAGTAEIADSAATAQTADEDTPVDQRVVHPEEVDREFDWRGWVLVGAIVVSFLVIPTIIVLYPHVGTMFGLSFWDAYLVLPMIPAVVLAAIAVWATTRP